MATLAQNEYLTAEVMTATPQRLHLLLIEGVIRRIECVRHCWRDGNEEKARETLVHAQRIVMEMITGIRRDVGRTLAKNVAAIYWFVYRSLVEANTQREEKKLDDALRVLRVEQDTWRLVCEQLGSSAAADAAGSFTLSQHSPDPAEPMPPPPTSQRWAEMPRMDSSQITAGGFSFEA